MKIFNKNEWKKVKLGDIFNLQMGKTPLRENKLYWNKGEYNWISISDMNFSEKYVSFTKEKITNLAVKESGIKIIPKNTVIMSFKLSIGKVKIVKEDIYSNEAIMAFIPKENFFIDKNFLYYCLKSLKWNEGINKAVKGLTLNKNLMSQKEIFLPDLAIQKEIANNLDGIDNLLELRKKQLIYLKELSKSLFTRMFGDIRSNSKNFEITFNTLISSNIYAEGYIIEENEDIFGYCLLSKTYSQEVGGMVCLVEELYIKEECRSKGIGTKVFEFLKERFKDYKRIRLEVEVNNKRAITLYNSIGFNELKYIQMVIDDIK